MKEMPTLVQNVLGSAVTLGGLTAIIMSFILPDKTVVAEVQEDEAVTETSKSAAS